MLYLLYSFRLFDDSYQKPGGFALLLHSGNKKTRKIDSFHVLFSMLNINFIGFKTSSFLKKTRGISFHHPSSGLEFIISRLLLLQKRISKNDQIFTVVDYKFEFNLQFL